MNPHEYCRRKLAGSSYYYSTLFLPPERREALNLLFALATEIGAIPRTGSDPGVARIKLQWWREELSRALVDRAPRHPATRLLPALVERYGLPPQDFMAIVDAAETELSAIRFPSFPELKAHCLQGAAPLWGLSCVINGHREDATPRAVRQLGGALGLAEAIQGLGEYARRGAIALPQDEMAQYQITDTDLLSLRHSARLAELLARQIARARLELRMAREGIPRGDRARQLNALVMAEIQSATLEEVQADGCRVLERRIALTPLRKLWIAWRSGRRWREPR